MTEGTPARDRLLRPDRHCREEGSELPTDSELEAGSELPTGSELAGGTGVGCSSPVSALCAQSKVRGALSVT